MNTSREKGYSILGHIVLANVIIRKNHIDMIGSTIVHVVPIGSHMSTQSETQHQTFIHFVLIPVVVITDYEQQHQKQN